MAKPSQAEIWKDIAEFKGLYQVSNKGRVRSLPRKIWNGVAYWQKPIEILKPYKAGSGYFAVCLVDKNKKRNRRFVHRLVATTFLSNDKNFPEVNHRDENKQNNQVENLEWCSHKYNQNYGSQSHRGAVTRGHAVIQLDKRGNKKKWESLRSAEKCGYTRSLIRECCEEKRKSYKGFVWKYV